MRRSSTNGELIAAATKHAAHRDVIRIPSLHATVPNAERIPTCRMTMILYASSMLLLLVPWNGNPVVGVSALFIRPSKSVMDCNLHGHAGPDTMASSSSSSSSLGRRRWFHDVATSITAVGTASILIPAQPAFAGGLLQFPIGPTTQPLKNKYHFMRAGPSELELEGIYSTNPLFLTNRENAMDPASGSKLVLEALAKIKRDAADLFPTVAYHSLAANGMDTADLIARELKLGREKLLPEFTYLDQRGIGLWDSGDETIVRPAIWALDVMEGGKLGMGGRPPANEDGTPNETLHDQFIRLRQFLSLQESRTAGEIILVIFPDGTGPALMSCMIAGIPFSDVHALEYEPGEVRLDISPESVMALYQLRKDDPAYLAKIEEGKEKLVALRKQRTIVGLKEQRAEQERLDIDAAYEQRKKADAEREQERQQLSARQREAQLQAQRELREARELERRQQQEARRKKRYNKDDTPVVANGATSDPSWAAMGTDDQSKLSITSMLATATLGIAGLGLAVMGATGKSNTDQQSDGTIGTIPKDSIGHAVSEHSESESSIVEPTLPSSTRSSTTPTGLGQSPTQTAERTTSVIVPESVYDMPMPVRGTVMNSADKERFGNDVDDDMIVDTITDSDKVIEDQLNQLVAAERAMKDALSEASKVKRSTVKGRSLDDDGIRDPYLPSLGDDGDNDWLRALLEIRDAVYDEDDEPELDLVINGDSQSSSLDRNITEWSM